MSRRDRIEDLLKARFQPSRLEVVDESFKHQGHSGSRPEGETHFKVRLASEAFRGMSRVARHRMVNAALAGEFADGLHALAIEAGEA
jgi:BolA protein